MIVCVQVCIMCVCIWLLVEMYGVLMDECRYVRMEVPCEHVACVGACLVVCRYASCVYAYGCL